MTLLRSDPARRAARAFMQGFLGIFAVSLVGWLGEITTWASTSGRQFPSVNPLGKMAIAGFAAGAAATVTYFWNLFEDKTGKPILIRKSRPDPEPTQAAEVQAARDQELPEGSSPGYVDAPEHENLLVTPEDEDWTPPIVTVYEPDPNISRVSEKETPDA